MGKSQTTSSKKDREKRKAQQRRDKAEKMEDRKANAKKGKNLDEMMAYLDENGNLSSTPPDPRKKRLSNWAAYQANISQQSSSDEPPVPRTRVVSFFNDAKGFGFIKDEQTQASVFLHVNQLSERVTENDKVSYDIEKGPKGLSAVNVKKTG